MRGVRLETQRAVAILASVALASAAVAAAGPVNFIGLMAPHAGRRGVGPSHEGLIPTAALLGGLIVVVADLVGRTIVAPLEIPCGLVTGAIGAPYLILLISSRRF